MAKDEAGAAGWYRQSAEHGDEAGQQLLAFAYMFGRAAAKDLIPLLTAMLAPGTAGPHWFCDPVERAEEHSIIDRICRSIRKRDAGHVLLHKLPSRRR